MSIARKSRIPASVHIHHLGHFLQSRHVRLPIDNQPENHKLSLFRTIHKNTLDALETKAETHDTIHKTQTTREDESMPCCYVFFSFPPLPLRYTDTLIAKNSARYFSSTRRLNEAIRWHRRLKTTQFDEKSGKEVYLNKVFNSPLFNTCAPVLMRVLSI